MYSSKNTYASLKVAVGGFLSLLAGLASQVVTAYLFGASSEMDAFYTALVIPLYLQVVLLGGLPFVVIPAFVSEETAGREDDAWGLAGTFFYLTGGLLLAGALVGALASRQIIAVTAPGFGLEKSLLAAQMLSIMMFTVPFIGLGNFTSGLGNVRNHFFWPAAATAIGSLGNLIILLILHPIIGPLALAWGNLISSILFASVTTLPVLRHGWKKTLSLNDPRLREMIRLIAPFILFGLITNSKMILERFYASGLPDGQLSYIGYAYKISNIFVILLAASIASVIFPAMARAYSSQGVKALVKETEYGLHLTLALAVPAVVITSVVALPLVRIFYERGAFIPATTLAVSLLIPIAMMNDVFFRMVSNLIARTFFVLKDTLTTNLVTSLTILLYFLIARVLTQQWGYWGLALAQPLQAGLAVIVASALLFRRVREFSVGELFKKFLLYSTAALTGGMAGWAVLRATAGLHNLIQFTAGTTAALLVSLALLYRFDRSIAVALLEMTGVKKIFSLIKPQRMPAAGASPRETKDH